MEESKRGASNKHVARLTGLDLDRQASTKRPPGQTGQPGLRAAGLGLICRPSRQQQQPARLSLLIDDGDGGTEGLVTVREP